MKAAVRNAVEKERRECALICDRLVESNVGPAAGEMGGVVETLRTERRNIAALIANQIRARR